MVDGARDDADLLAAGVDTCIGITKQTPESCMHGAAESYRAHGDPERLARDMEGCS